MFLQVSVILFTGGWGCLVLGGVPALRERGVSGPGGVPAPGVVPGPRGMPALGRGACS